MPGNPSTSPLWLAPRSLLLVLVVLIFIIMGAWNNQNAASPQATATLLPAAQSEQVVDSGPTSTPLPPEFLSNTNQTIGITFGSSVLILIVVAGVLGTIIRRNRADHQS